MSPLVRLANQNLANQNEGQSVMKTYEITCEISGPTAMWTRPDTGDVPVSYPAPTYGVVKGIFESILWLKSDFHSEGIR
jgi:CRISPR-associated Cas5-like protein